MKRPSEKFLKNCELIKWCTPSILPEVFEKYNLDMEGSVSIASLGKIQNNTKIFAQIHKLAAQAYKNNGHSHYGCEGTTGANRVLFDLISKELSTLSSSAHVLSSRNVHQSVVVSALKNRVPIRYLPTCFDEDTGLFLPPTLDEIASSITPNTKVLLLTNPTYEGYSSDLQQIADFLRQNHPDTLLYIDEAWGAHLPFSPDIPMSGTQVDADFVVQSIHKQGGAPNPSNITHLGIRATRELYPEFLESYESNMSTTYSYPLIAAMDFARSLLQTQGEKRIEELRNKAESLKEFATQIPGIQSIEYEIGTRVCSVDDTKVNLDVRHTGIPGDYIAEQLEKHHNIITEKEEIGSVCFLTTFQLTKSDVEETKKALQSVFETTTPGQTIESYAPLPNLLETVYPAYEVAHMQKNHVKLEDSVGKIMAENIKCYPPGIYVIQMGERVNSQLISYLDSIKGRTHVCAIDPTLEYVKILEE
ncbi:MAG: hypothetical protein MAG795_00687 [Candidatus Woesearchaeota archaeon]|nr:hypothetical protein [Candidatus Woesearchaeota archaeon]